MPYVWCPASTGKPGRCSVGGQGCGHSGPDFYWGKPSESLGLVLPFAWRKLEGPLQCDQLAVEPLLAGLELVFHQLFELLQLLVQLSPDVSSEERDVTCRTREGETLGPKGSPLAGLTITKVPRGLPLGERRPRLRRTGGLATKQQWDLRQVI